MDTRWQLKLDYAALQFISRRLSITRSHAWIWYIYCKLVQWAQMFALVYATVNRAHMKGGNKATSNKRPEGRKDQTSLLISQLNFQAETHTMWANGPFSVGNYEISGKDVLLVCWWFGEVSYCTCSWSVFYITPKFTDRLGLYVMVSSSDKDMGYLNTFVP